MAHPQATVEVGSETFQVTAVEVMGEERINSMQGKPLSTLDLPTMKRKQRAGFQ